MPPVDRITPTVTTPARGSGDTTFPAQPPIDIATLPEGKRETARYLVSLREEAAGWQSVYTAAGEAPGAAQVTRIVNSLDRLLNALKSGAEVDQLAGQTAAVRSLSALESAHPAAAMPPQFDSSSLSGSARELFGSITSNRTALVQRHAEAVSDNRPGITRRIALAIHQLDSAARILTTGTDPAKAQAQAREIAQGVITGFDTTIRGAWDKQPSAAQTQSEVSIVRLDGAAGPVVTPRVDPVGDTTVDKVDTTTPPPANDRLTALERRLTDLETENRGLNDQIEARKTAEAEEAKKPGFMRALLEIFEFMGRWFTPFFNMISALFRILKIGYKLLTGQKVDWMNEGIRLVGDIAGIFFPPIGALVNEGMNLYNNESQMMGGMNDMFDDAQKDNPFRSGFDSTSGWVKKTFDSAKNTLTGAPPTPSKGSVDFRPVAVDMPT